MCMLVMVFSSTWLQLASGGFSGRVFYVVFAYERNHAYRKMEKFNNITAS